jgi:hypothetical protein
MIAERLNLQSVLTPSLVKKKRGEDLGRKECNQWTPGTVRKILKNPVYLGHMVQGKERKISFKEKKERVKFIPVFLKPTPEEKKSGFVNLLNQTGFWTQGL